MEIRQLRYFIAVADTLNFSRAASSVYLSQSALSRQIMDLEKEVGLPLFRRSTRQVELTDAGRALQKSAKELISRWEKMLPEVRNAVSDEARSLTLTIGVDARSLARPESRKEFLELLYDMRRDYPGLRVLLRSLDYQDIIKGLYDKTLDCAMILDRIPENKVDIMQQYFGREEMVLVFRSANVHTDADYGDVITKRGLIMVDREPQGLYHIIHILSALSLEPQIRFCETLEDMTMTVETGESATILPESVVAKLDNPQLTVLRLPTEMAELQRTLLWPKNHMNPVLDVLRERMKNRVFRETELAQGSIIDNRE